MILIGDIYLKMEMISVGISRVSDFTDIRTGSYDIAFAYEDFRKMRIV